MSFLLGVVLIYLLPACWAFVFWFLVKRLIGHWTHRDLMLSLIPKARDVHVMERLLGIRTRPNGRTVSN